jgi:hypothetical protein
MRALAIICLLASAAAAQAPGQVGEPSTRALAAANSAAVAGDWKRVDELVAPLITGQLGNADLAEAHRLAGLAAYFNGRKAEAEDHFVLYLKLDLDAHLDPTLVPPDAVTFFNDVRAKHAAELRALRPRDKRHWMLNLVPPFGQLQNHDTGKAIVIGSAMGVFLATNITTYFVLRSWCTQTSGSGGVGASCDATTDHTHASASLRTLNITTGIAFIATYAYGVYDGVVGYRRHTHEHFVAPFATGSNDGALVGVFGSF